MNSVKIALLNTLESQQNAHLSGSKKVFIHSAESGTSLTQFAYGSMSGLQESGVHVHKTMDEYFYFIKGAGLYIIDGIEISICSETFVKIPAGIFHNLINIGTEHLEFVYFGIATEK